MSGRLAGWRAACSDASLTTGPAPCGSRGSTLRRNRSDAFETVAIRGSSSSAPATRRSAARPGVDRGIGADRDVGGAEHQIPEGGPVQHERAGQRRLGGDLDGDPTTVAHGADDPLLELVEVGAGRL
jgi:hypothetical protein